MTTAKMRITREQAKRGGAVPHQLFWWVCYQCGAIEPTLDPKDPKPAGWISTVLDTEGLPEVVLCDECADQGQG